MADANGKNIFDVVDRIAENESPAAQQMNLYRAAALSPLVSGNLDKSIDKYEASALLTEKKQAKGKMKPKHAAFIMATRRGAVEDNAHLHRKFTGR